MTFPFPSAYMTNIDAPLMAVPIPKPTHWYKLGAEREKYRSPVEEVDMEDPVGIPTS